MSWFNTALFQKSRQAYPLSLSGKTWWIFEFDNDINSDLISNSLDKTLSVLYSCRLLLVSISSNFMVPVPCGWLVVISLPYLPNSGLYNHYCAKQAFKTNQLLFESILFMYCGLASFLAHRTYMASYYS